MIVELYGCPGCGKTYLIHQLTGNDNTVAMSNNRLKNFVIGKIKGVSFYLPESVKLYKSIISCVKNEKQEPVYIDRTVEQFARNIVLLAFGYRHIKKDILMAEGLVHRVVSMAVNFGWNADVIDRLMMILSGDMKDVKPFYLKVDIETCFSSIKQRNRHETQMDELDDNELKEFLCAYHNLFNHITEHYHFTEITRDNYASLKEVLE